MIQQELSQTLQNLYVHVIPAGTSTVKGGTGSDS
jgi:hypothetical protein